MAANRERPADPPLTLISSRLAVMLLPLSGFGLTDAVSFGHLAVVVLSAAVILTSRTPVSYSRATFGHLGVILVAYASHQWVYHDSTSLASGLVLVQGALTMFFIAHFTRWRLDSRGSLDGLIVPYVLGAVLSSLVAVVQWRAPGLDLPFVWSTETSVRRVVGLSKHSNLLGLNAAVALVGLRLGSLAPRTKYAFGAMLLVGIVLSGSRSPAVAVVVAMMVGLVAARTGRDRRRLVTAFVVVSVAGGALMMGTPQGRFLRTRIAGEAGVTGDTERFELVATGWGNFTENWMIGFPRTERLYHNLYLSHASVLGIFAAASLVLIVGWSLWRGWEMRRNSVGLGLLMMAAIAAGTAMVHNSIAETTIWFCLALPLAAHGADRASRLTLANGQELA